MEKVVLRRTEAGAVTVDWARSDPTKRVTMLKVPLNADLTPFLSREKYTGKVSDAFFWSQDASNDMVQKSLKPRDFCFVQGYSFVEDRYHILLIKLGRVNASAFEAIDMCKGDIHLALSAVDPLWTDTFARIGPELYNVMTQMSWTKASKWRDFFTVQNVGFTQKLSPEFLLSSPAFSDCNGALGVDFITKSLTRPYELHYDAMGSEMSCTDYSGHLYEIMKSYSLESMTGWVCFYTYVLICLTPRIHEMLKGKHTMPTAMVCFMIFTITPMPMTKKTFDQSGRFHAIRAKALSLMCFWFRDRDPGTGMGSFARFLLMVAALDGSEIVRRQAMALVKADACRILASLCSAPRVEVNFRSKDCTHVFESSESAARVLIRRLDILEEFQGEALISTLGVLDACRWYHLRHMAPGSAARNGTLCSLRGGGYFPDAPPLRIVPRTLLVGLKLKLEKFIRSWPSLDILDMLTRNTALSTSSIDVLLGCLPSEIHLDERHLCSLKTAAARLGSAARGSYVGVDVDMPRAHVHAYRLHNPFEKYNHLLVPRIMSVDDEPGPCTTWALLAPYMYKLYTHNKAASIDGIDGLDSADFDLDHVGKAVVAGFALKNKARMDRVAMAKMDMRCTYLR